MHTLQSFQETYISALLVPKRELEVAENVSFSWNKLVNDKWRPTRGPDIAEPFSVLQDGTYLRNFIISRLQNSLWQT